MNKQFCGICLLSLALVLCVADTSATVRRLPKSMQTRISHITPMKYKAKTGAEVDIYNFKEGGYALVSTSDSLPALLGVVDHGVFDADEAAPAMLSFIEDITAMATESRVLSERAPVAPLVKTHWNQTWPYNKLCPKRQDVQCPTGCVATAMAQLIRTIGGATLQGTGGYTDNGVSKTLDFANLGIDLANMPLAPDGGEGTEQIAKLMLACGVAVNMAYGPDQSAAMVYDAEQGLIEHFDYDPTYTMIHWRMHYTPSEWERLIYSEFEAGRPVYYAGQNGVESGHAFLCDGYDGNGLWHINWGWGGMSDGYFPLTSLNPSVIGTGGGSGGGYSGLQRVITIVPKDVAVKPNFRRVLGSCTQLNGNTFAVMFRQTGASASCIIAPAICVVADTPYGEPQILATVPLGELELSAWALHGTGWHHTLDVGALNLPAGKYRLYAAWRESDTEYWTLARPETNEETFYEILTIHDGGSYDVSHPEPMRKDLTVVELEVMERCRASTSADVRLTVANHTNEDFSGNFPLDIVNADGQVVRTYNVELNVPIGTFRQRHLSLPLVFDDDTRIPVGQYTLVAPGFTDPIAKFEIENYIPGVLSGTDGLSVTNAKDMPEVLYLGQKWTHVPMLSNSKSSRREGIGLAFYTPAGTWVRQLGRAYHDIPAGIAPVEMDFEVTNLTPGIYSVAYYCGGDLCPRRTVRIGDCVDGVYYVPVSDNPPCAAVFAPEEGYYRDEVAVKPSVRLGSTDYTVTALYRNAFFGCQKLELLDLPSSVTELGVNSLGQCTGLRHLLLPTDAVTHPSNIAVATGLNGQLSMYVSQQCHAMFNDPKVALGQVYTRLEQVSANSDNLTLNDCAENVQITATPCTETLHPELNVTSDAPQVAEATARFNPNYGWDLMVEPKADGQTNLTLNAAQPKVQPLHVNVTVVNGGTSVILNAGQESNGPFRMKVNQNLVMVWGVRPNTNITVFDTNGRQVAQAQADAEGECALRIDTDGIYVLHAAPYCLKLRIQQR